MANVELIGIVASVFIIAAFCFKNIVLIRVFDGIGAVMYIVYGLCIGSFSVVLLNAVLVAVQVVRIVGLKKKR